MGFNKISVELLALDLCPPVSAGCEGLRDEVIFFVQPPSENFIEQATHEETLLVLQPPSAPVVIGRYSSAASCCMTCSSHLNPQQHYPAFCTQRHCYRSIRRSASYGPS